MAKWMVICKDNNKEADKDVIFVEFFDTYRGVLGYMEMIDELYDMKYEIYERQHGNMDGWMEYRRIRHIDLVCGDYEQQEED